MEKTFNLELTPEEFVVVSAGIGCFHKETAKALYESLEGTRDKDKAINVEEFDNQHKILMGLYDKLSVIADEYNAYLKEVDK